MPRGPGPVGRQLRRSEGGHLGMNDPHPFTGVSVVSTKLQTLVPRPPALCEQAERTLGISAQPSGLSSHRLTQWHDLGQPSASSSVKPLWVALAYSGRHRFQKPGLSNQSSSQNPCMCQGHTEAWRGPGLLRGFSLLAP